MHLSGVGGGSKSKLRLGGEADSQHPERLFPICFVQQRERGREGRRERDGWGETGREGRREGDGGAEREGEEFPL